MINYYWLHVIECEEGRKDGEAISSPICFINKILTLNIQCVN